MIVLFLPAAATLIAMLVVSMAPIFHFVPKEEGNSLPVRLMERFQALRESKKALLEQVAGMDQAATMERMA